jgi:acetyl esterase/lipase
MRAMIGAPGAIGKSDCAWPSCRVRMAPYAGGSDNRGVEETGKVVAFPQAPDAVELRHLRAFVAVAEELNFGRGADRLHVSQPALSRQIRSLEQLVGTELFRRSTHGVELTMAGEALLDRARKLLSDIDEAVTAAQSVGGELIARVARLWEPITGEATADANLQAMRDAYEELHAQFPIPDGVRVRPVNAGGVNSLVVSSEPADPPTIVLLHGGGFVLGSAFGYRPFAGALAAAAGSGVLVPDFRLAPEHPHPAALDDALAAYAWLLEQGADPATVSVCGDSAGGGMAMALLLALKDRGLPLPGAGILFCPAVDVEGNLQDPDDPRHVMTFEVTSRFTKAYLGDHPVDDPIISPLYADLTGLPPLLIQGASGDHVIADAHALAKRAREHRIYSRLEVYPVEAHVFQLFWSFLPEAAEAVERAGVFARDIRESGDLAVEEDASGA